MSKKQTENLQHHDETPNIFKKMFFSFIVVPIIPVLALLYLSYIAQVEGEKAVNNNLVGAAKLIGANINTWIEKNVYVSQLSSNFDDIQSMDPIRQKPLLEKIKNQSETITAVRIDNENGLAITRSDNKKLQDYSDRQYFQQVKGGGNIGQQVIFGKTQQKPLLCFTVPIRDIDEQFLGALNQCSTLENISNDVTNLQIGETGFAFLVDGSNKLIAYGGPDKQLSGQLEDMSYHPALRSTTNDELFSDKVDDKKVIFFKQQVGLDWTLVVQQNYNEAFASAIQTRRNAIIATILTVLLSLLIIYLMSKSIAKPLQEARQETDNILGSVNDGLFLINKEYVIGSQQSANLSSILQKGKLSGKSFMRYLNESVPSDIAQMAKDYIDLLFSKRIKEQLVKSRNPLNSIQTSIENQEGELESKFLSLTFKRVYQQEEITNLLVTARDITKETLLQRELEKAKEEKDEQVNLLTDILYIAPSDLQSFLNQTRSALNNVNAILEKSGSGNQIYNLKIEKIFQLIHKIKGDAAAINFNLFANECHNFEEILAGMRAKKSKLTGNEFLPVALALEELFRKCTVIDNLYEKIENFVSENERANDTDSNVPEFVQQWNQLKVLAEGLAERHSKSVEVHLKGFKTRLPNHYQNALKDVATQLVRNSIAHGIETKEIRHQQGKIEDGQITMMLKRTLDNGYTFTYMDDGQGIDYDKIKAKIIAKNMATAEEAEGLTEQELVHTLFKDGFSLKDSADFDAGRGVGLPLVFSKVKELNGKIKIASVLNKRIMFKIILPSPALLPQYTREAG